MVVTAPRDGSVLRLIARQGGEMVKAGDPIAQFVPDTEARAVELWLDGIDAPLVTPGRHVRLQFEGWPAVHAELARVDPKLAELAQLHLFGGLSISEIAELTGTAERSAFRQWRTARMYLIKSIGESGR